MVSGSVICGSALSSEIRSVPEPGMLKSMTSWPGEALAFAIACLREPAPLSLVVVTQ
jgi:hypothetical protein